jgi:hypothetical protein
MDTKIADLDTLFSENSENITPFFECKLCDYKCSKKQHIVQHNMTQKHKINLGNHLAKNGNCWKPHHIHVCKCGKAYANKSGLWKHTKICEQCKKVNPPFNNNKNNNNKSDVINEFENEMNKTESFDKNLLFELLKQNQELQKQLIEMSFKNNSNTINNSINDHSINTNCNNSFNLQFFLNEKCKDAMNMSEFIDTIKLQLSDLEKFEHDGYADGVSNIILKGLYALDAYLRPIHCSDLKRETVYIKDNDCWVRETDEKLVLKNAIRKVAFKNIKQINEWVKINPDCKDPRTKKFDKYNKIVMNSMSGVTEEEQADNINKIVRNVTKAVVIDKYTVK